jgi:hypothetical protein
MVAMGAVATILYLALSDRLHKTNSAYRLVSCSRAFSLAVDLMLRKAFDCNNFDISGISIQDIHALFHERQNFPARL